MDGTLSERFKAEMAKLKGMTFKEKADFIWEYYRIPIITFAAVALIFGSIINSVFINPPKKSYVHLSIYGPYVDSQLMDNLGQEITDLIVADTDNYTVYTSNFYDDPSNIEVNMAVQQKFFAMIAARELDIIIGAEQDIGGLAVEDTLLDLTDIIALLGDIPEADILKTPTISIEEPAPYAIMLHDTEIMRNNGLNTDGYYMGVLINSMRVQEAAEAMRELLGT